MQILSLHLTVLTENVQVLGKIWSPGVQQAVELYPPHILHSSLAKWGTDSLTLRPLLNIKSQIILIVFISRIRNLHNLIKTKSVGFFIICF